MMIRQVWWKGSGGVVRNEFASEGLDSLTFGRNSGRGNVFVVLQQMVDSTCDVVVDCERVRGILPQVVNKFVKLWRCMFDNDFR